MFRKLKNSYKKQSHNNSHKTKFFLFNSKIYSKTHVQRGFEGPMNPYRLNKMAIGPQNVLTQKQITYFLITNTENRSFTPG